MEHSESSSAKTWGVGVELAEDHLGPSRFAATLTQNGPDDLTIGIHVIPNLRPLRPTLSDEEIEETRKRAVINVTDVLAREGLDGDRVRVELSENDEIERGLIEAATRLDVDALILGRRARRNEEPVVRLGEVARRVLRRLPVPVIVVPPDYGNRDDPGLGEGPVILATDLSEHSAAAAQFARELVVRLDRELLLAHCTQAYHWAVSYVSAATLDGLQAQSRASASASLQRWAQAHGLENVRQHVCTGDPVKQVLQLAYTEDAAMLVAGSRMLGPVERLFAASVSSELAAAAACPVAVVPAHD
jgi:nucleotide-binding universal stress UspA family protein